jgi:cbb3-type cytochrome oxidase maturation protein
MEQSLVMLMILSLFLGCGCWLFFLWGVHRGEFEDIEGPKYRMLEEEDEAIGSKACHGDQVEKKQHDR